MTRGDPFRAVWATVALAGACACAFLVGAQRAGAGGEWDPESACRAVDSGILEQHIGRLAGCGSRVPGYEGHDAALAYIREQFLGMGLTDMAEDTFFVTVPVDEGSSLETAGVPDRIQLRALWPNLVRTSQVAAEGLAGTAVDGGKGTWADLNGKTVKDSVVFIDFNSEANWLNAAMLGAVAIVFVEPEWTVRRQAEDKTANVPLNVPRFWMSRGDYVRFAPDGFGKTVRVRCRMPWKRAPARNLRVRLRGAGESEAARPLVCIHAYYDSMSVVPALAPGAQAACGMAAMLELARILKADPPPVDVLFLASSAHHLSHEGIRDFMQRHARKRRPFADLMTEPIHPDLMLCLDFSSGSETLGVAVHDAWEFKGNSKLLYTREFLRHAQRFRDYAQRLGPVLQRSPDDLCLNLVQPEGGGVWRSVLPEAITLDSAVAMTGATPAFSLVTAHDPREAWDTPLDLPPGVDMANLALQTRFLAGALGMGLRDPEWLRPPKMDEDRLLVFRGRLVTFDPRKGFMPDDAVSGGIGRLCRKGINMADDVVAGVAIRTERLAMADDDGRFEILTSAAWKMGLEGYDLDPATGDITRALDLGLEGVSQYPVEFIYDAFLKERTAVLFNCRATDLYDIVDPRYLIAMNKLSLLDPGNAEPFSYGYSLQVQPIRARSSRAASYATVYSKPGVPLKVGVSSDVLGQRMLFLNSPAPDSRREAEGLGYEVGSLRLVENAPFQVLRDMHNLNAYRIGIVKRFGIENRRLDRLHAAGGEALREARASLAALQWDGFIKQARRGLGIESRAYPDVRATADDVVKGIVFYMALLIPFALFCERLFFAFPDLKRRLIAFAGFFFATYLALRLVHPAFKIVETSEVILLGLIILTLCSIVVAISAGRFEAQMRSLKQKRGRVHDTDVSRTSATATAFALGVSNMRRRKVRTFLTCTAIVLLMFTVLSFTSVRTFLRPRMVPRPYAPLYQGALVRDRTWVPLKFLALDHLASEFADVAIMGRRSWLAPGAISDEFTQLAISVRPSSGGGDGDRRYRASGLVGLDPSEVEITGVQALLTAGRWFAAGERNVCILPDAMADELGIGAADVGSTRVRFLGKDALVIGLVDSRRFGDLKDLDNEALTPLDFSMLNRQALGRATQAGTDVSAIEGRAPLESFVHLDGRGVILMPYDTVLDLGGTLQAVALKFPGQSVGERIERLLDRLALTVFVGEGDRVNVYSSLASSSIGGVGNILVPLLIAALMVLNTMSGSVHERLKEIGTYSSVGLAPSHIGALFLAEACVYAILGGIAGYVIGQVVTKGLSVVGGLKGLTLNYSSLTSVLATGLVMATVILSTLYPARMAARMAVPDVTRKWALPDPVGDEWDFDFPFTVSSKEVRGLYVFFRYFFSSFEEQSVGRFYTADTRLVNDVAGGQPAYRLTMRAWLAPYDLGVSQDVAMQAEPTGAFGVYQIRLRIHRVSGETRTWVRINRGFLNEIRKQFLLWRTVPADGKAEYGAEADDAFARQGER